MRWEIQYSYQFFSQKKHYFFIEAVMRLRHKKPLNPYKGQTNNDKNEFNDDDFNQQGSPHKKAANGSTDQIYKYARILAKFIKTINQDVKEYQPAIHGISQDSYHPIQVDLSSSSAPPPQAAISQQNRLQKHLEKLQIKNETKEEQKEGKSIQKKRNGSITPAISKQPRPKLQQNQPSCENTVDRPKNSIIPKATNPSHQEKIPKEIKPTKVQPPKVGNIQQMGFLGNPHQQSIKCWDGAMMGPQLAPNIQNYLSLSKMLAQGQIPPGLSVYPQLTSLQMSHMPMRFQGTIPPANGCFPMTFLSLQNSPLVHKPWQAMPSCNLFNEHLKTTLNKNPSANKSAFPLKRSAYHVSIAYKIYLDKLQKQGVTLNYQRLDEIDPTRHARRIKSMQGQNNKNKDNKKKK